MSYSNHLAQLIAALESAAPGVSKRALAAHANVDQAWVHRFCRFGTGTLDRADRVVAAIRDLCPQGPQGDEVRRLLALLDAARAEAGCPAEDAA
jgi:hypothetical protein